MKGTGSASLLSHAPAGFCSHLLEAAISVMVGTLSQEEREERKKERRREGGNKDPKSAAIDFLFHQVHPLASTESCREAGLQRKGRSAEQGKCQRKEHRSKACGESRPVQCGEQSR